MTPGLAPLFVLFRRLCELKFSLALVVLSATPVSALAKSPYDNPATAEGWAWVRIKEGQAADFNKRCKTDALDARTNDEKTEKSWQDNCRRLDAKFLVDVLTSMRWCRYSGKPEASLRNRLTRKRRRASGEVEEGLMKLVGRDMPLRFLTAVVLALMFLILRMRRAHPRIHYAS